MPVSLCSPGDTASFWVSIQESYTPNPHRPLCPSRTYHSTPQTPTPFTYTLTGTYLEQCPNLERVANASAYSHTPMNGSGTPKPTLYNSALMDVSTLNHISTLRRTRSSPSSTVNLTGDGTPTNEPSSVTFKRTFAPNSSRRVNHTGMPCWKQAS